MSQTIRQYKEIELARLRRGQLRRLASRLEIRFYRLTADLRTAVWVELDIRGKLIRGQPQKVGRAAKSRRLSAAREAPLVPCRTNISKGPYEYRGVTYPTKAALVFGYLDAHKVSSGMVKPPSVADFVRDTGVQAGHGMYGARLHEYCHRPRKDERGMLYVIDRNAFRKGATDGRLYVEPEEPHHELSAHA
jgi:hypothetical protein